MPKPSLLLSPWKNCLLRKQSLVPERLETAGRDNRVCHCHKFRKTAGYPEEISLLTQKIELLLGYRPVTQPHNSDLGEIQRGPAVNIYQPSSDWFCVVALIKKTITLRNWLIVSWKTNFCTMTGMLFLCFLILLVPDGIHSIKVSFLTDSGAQMFFTGHWSWIFSWNFP